MVLVQPSLGWWSLLWVVIPNWPHLGLRCLVWMAPLCWWCLAWVVVLYWSCDSHFFMVYHLVVQTLDACGFGPIHSGHWKMSYWYFLGWGLIQELITLVGTLWWSRVWFPLGPNGVCLGLSFSRLIESLWEGTCA